VHTIDTKRNQAEEWKFRLRRNSKKCDIMCLGIHGNRISHVYYILWDVTYYIPRLSMESHWAIFSSTKRFWWLDQPPMFVQETVVRCRLKSTQTHTHTRSSIAIFFGIFGFLSFAACERQLHYARRSIPPLAAISFFCNSCSPEHIQYTYNSFVGHVYAWEIRINTNFGELGAHQCQAYY